MIRPTVSFGRIAGIRIGAHWSVLVITALLAVGLYSGALPAGAPGEPEVVYAVTALLVSVAFLVCLTGHEMAHALAARRYGVRVDGITLWLLGGVSVLQDEAPSPRAELAIAGAGPATSLAFGALGGIAAALAGLWSAPRLLLVALVWLAVTNLMLGLFNLIPGAPLDGGRVLRAILWQRRGDRDSAQLSADRAGIGIGTALVLVGLGLVLVLNDFTGLWLSLIGWFLISAARRESEQVRMHGALGSLRVGDIMAPDPVCGYEHQIVNDFLHEVALRTHHRVFPVVDLDRRLTGVVSLSVIARLTPAQRNQQRLRDIMLPAGRFVAVSADQPVEEAAGLMRSVQPLVPVVAGGKLVGVLSITDVSRAVELADLLTPPATRTVAVSDEH
jgi:Zn-dependent protease/CBS domain-containing protein